MSKTAIAILVICAAFFTQCISHGPSVKQIERAAIYLASNVDSNSLSLLKRYSYEGREADRHWRRVSRDTSLYICSYTVKKDTAELTVWHPYDFIKDFPSVYVFDTSTYSKYTFSAVRDKIVSITFESNQLEKIIMDTSIFISQFFPVQNPFVTFSDLDKLEKQYKFIGTSYRSNIGDFIVFALSPVYRLYYMPDTTKLNEQAKLTWLEGFKRGKQIKPGWSLINASGK